MEMGIYRHQWSMTTRLIICLITLHQLKFFRSAIGKKYKNWLGEIYSYISQVQVAF